MRIRNEVQIDTRLPDEQSFKFSLRRLAGLD
jgi:hypothetical protein